MPKIHTISFKHAFNGLKTAFITQPNFQFHLLAALIAVILGFALNISLIEWLFLILTVFLVIVSELVNTSIEAVVDLLTEQHNQYAKIAKDVAAAAVLLTALNSLVVGTIIFLPKILVILGISL